MAVVGRVGENGPAQHGDAENAARRLVRQYRDPSEIHNGTRAASTIRNDGSPFRRNQCPQVITVGVGQTSFA